MKTTNIVRIHTRTSTIRSVDGSLSSTVCPLRAGKESKCEPHRRVEENIFLNVFKTSETYEYQKSTMKLANLQCFANIIQYSFLPSLTHYIDLVIDNIPL